VYGIGYLLLVGVIPFAIPLTIDNNTGALFETVEPISASLEETDTCAP
jgi:hypothetical protein